MKKTGVFIVAAILFCSGCGITVVPRATSTARVDMATGAISETKSGLTVTARVQDLEVVPYLMDNNITSFYLTVANNSSRRITIPLDSFLLIDNRGKQYRPITNDRMREIINQNAPYLIPYPYVGYYYLEDIEKAGASRSFESFLPYYAENHPRDVAMSALPDVSTVVPGAHVSGTIFFTIDLSLTQAVDLRGYLPDSSKDLPADFVLPFSIEKK